MKKIAPLLITLLLVVSIALIAATGSRSRAQGVPRSPAPPTPSSLGPIAFRSDRIPSGMGLPTDGMLFGFTLQTATSLPDILVSSLTFSLTASSSICAFDVATIKIYDGTTLVGTQTSAVGIPEGIVNINTNLVVGRSPKNLTMKVTFRRRPVHGRLQINLIGTLARGTDGVMQTVFRRPDYQPLSARYPVSSKAFWW
jgi:hypothetical protein